MCLQLDGLLQDCLELINTLAVDYFSITKPIQFHSNEVLGKNEYLYVSISQCFISISFEFVVFDLLLCACRQNVRRGGWPLDCSQFFRAT